MREDNGLTHKNQQVFIIMNPIDLNLEPPILAVSIIYDVYLQLVHNIIISNETIENWLTIQIFPYLKNRFQQPFHCEIEHKIGLTCVTNGPVTCRVRLDRGGYVPGEAISIWATITNNSSVTIKHTRASLTEVSFGLLLQSCI